MLQGEFISHWFQRLEAQQLDWGLIRGLNPDTLQREGRDIDILVQPSCWREIIKLLPLEGFRILTFWYRYSCVSFTVTGFEDGPLIIDLLLGTRIKGIEFLDSNAILDRASGNKLHQIEPLDQALFSLLHNELLSGVRKARDSELIRIEFSTHTNEAKSRLSFRMQDDNASEIVDLITSEARDQAVIAACKRASIFAGQKFNPLMMLWCRSCHLASELRIRVTGDDLSAVIFLGPDGAGKSALCDLLADYLSDSYRSVTIKHYPIRFFGVMKAREHSGASSSPHELQPRGVLSSVVKAFVLFLECWLYWLNERQRSSRLLIFDRFFDDLTLDPLRYRLAKSGQVVAQLLLPFAPARTIWINVSAPVDVIQSRKQEVEPAETAGQLERYAGYLSKKTNAIEVSNRGELNDVAESMIKKVELVLCGIAKANMKKRSLVV